MNSALVGYDSDSESEVVGSPQVSSPPSTTYSIKSLITDERLWVGTDYCDKIKDESITKDSASKSRLASFSSEQVGVPENEFLDHFKKWYTPLHVPGDDASDSMSKDEIYREIGIDHSLQYMRLEYYEKRIEKCDSRLANIMENYDKLEPEGYGDTILDNINRLNQRKRKIDQMKK